MTDLRPVPLPGSTPPAARLAVNGRRTATGRAPSWESILGALRPRRPFPYVAPTWPDSVPLPSPERRLGVDYDTDWARRYPARLARAVLTEAVARPAMAALARPAVDGLDRIGHLEGSVIFAANHASHIDTPLLLSVLPEPWRHRVVVAGAADYFFDTTLKAATFALVINAVPIERQRVSRTSANRAIALVQQGWSLVIFPEGGRSPDGWGQGHKPGAAWLSVRTGRPLVPVHIAGTASILPRHAGRIRPGRTTITFGRPLLPRHDDDPRRLAAELEAEVAALADEGSTDWWTARRRAATATTPALTGPGVAGSWRRTWALGAPAHRSPSHRSSTAPSPRRWPR